METNKKINIAELLKDCPSGMELDCPIYDNTTLLSVDDREDIIFPIRVLREDGNSITLTKYGQFTDADFAKCVIFPKGKTTWVGFVPPCKFKDGDVLYIDCNDDGDTDKLYQFIFILKEISECKIHCYCYIDKANTYKRFKKSYFLTDTRYSPRLATEEEKQRLFDAIKANGYKWNPEANTLEKLIEPKFKVGDVIQDEDGYKVKITEVNLEDEYYGYESMILKGIGGIGFSEQDDWELIHNKFDIYNLKPFNKVLCRQYKCSAWMPSFFGFYNEDASKNPFICSNGFAYKYCVPYEENKHLLGTANDCDDYYKTWEE